MRSYALPAALLLLGAPGAGGAENILHLPLVAPGDFPEIQFPAHGYCFYGGRQFGFILWIFAFADGSPCRGYFDLPTTELANITIFPTVPSE